MEEVCERIQEGGRRAWMKMTQKGRKSMYKLKNSPRYESCADRSVGA